jgi:hypothetical protein
MHRCYHLRHLIVPLTFNTLDIVDSLILLMVFNPSKFIQNCTVFRNLKLKKFFYSTAFTAETVVSFALVSA